MFYYTKPCPSYSCPDIGSWLRLRYPVLSGTLGDIGKDAGQLQEKSQLALLLLNLILEMLIAYEEFYFNLVRKVDVDLDHKAALRRPRVFEFSSNYLNMADLRLSIY